MSIPSPSHTSYVLLSNHPFLSCFSSLFYFSNLIFTNNINLLILFHPHYPFILFFSLPIITMLITTFYCQKSFLTIIYHPYPPLYFSNTHTTPSHPQDTIPTSSPTISLKIPKNNYPIICTLPYLESYLYFISIFLFSSSLSHSHNIKLHNYPQHLFHCTSLALQFTSNIPKIPRQLHYVHLLLLHVGMSKVI